MTNTARGQILAKAIELTEGDRNKAYGDPKDNLQVTADLWNAYLSGRGTAEPLEPHDVANMMALLKISRTIVSPDRLDNYIDGSAYLAIAGECAGPGEVDADA